MRIRSALILTVCLIIAAFPVFAQVQTGTPPFGSFSGGPDVINNGNLNVHYTIPIANKAGRGIPFVYNITYDSSIWAPTPSGSSMIWQPATNWGWSNSMFKQGYLLYTASIDGAQFWVSFGGVLYSGTHNDATGTALNGSSMILSGAVPAAKAIGGDIGKSIPVIGAFVSGIGALDDSWHVYQDYEGCVAGTT